MLIFEWNASQKRRFFIRVVCSFSKKSTWLSPKSSEPQSWFLSVFWLRNPRFLRSVWDRVARFCIPVIAVFGRNRRLILSESPLAAHSDLGDHARKERCKCNILQCDFAKMIHLLYRKILLSDTAFFSVNDSMFDPNYRSFLIFSSSFSLRLVPFWPVLRGRNGRYWRGRELRAVLLRFTFPSVSAHSPTLTLTILPFRMQLPLS